MSADPQWTVEDLVLRYDLEPDLCDVFVEGCFDQDVLQACFKAAGDDQRVCYPIESVNVTDSILKQYELTDGNKQRVMALAMELNAATNEASCKCLVDSDLEIWIGHQLKAPYLIRTKYTSLDLYFFSEELLKRLLLISGKAKIADWASFFNSLVSMLKDLYALRLADNQLKLYLKWSPWAKCLEKKETIIKFDVADYSKRVLLANGHGKDIAAFSKAFLEWQKKLTEDPRLCIRGHDFIEAISWVIGKFGGKKEFSTPEAIEGAFLLVAEEASEVLKELESPGLL